MFSLPYSDKNLIIKIVKDPIDIPDVNSLRKSNPVPSLFPNVLMKRYRNNNEAIKYKNIPINKR